MPLGSDSTLGAAVEPLGAVKGTVPLGSDSKLGATVEPLGSVKGTVPLGSDSKLGAAGKTLPGKTLRINPLWVETLGAVVIDSNEPDSCEVVVNKGTEYVVPDASETPDILLIY